MSTALGWLAELLGTLGSLIPQWHHLESIYVGVAITRGNRIKPLKPGIIWYWPFWTMIYYRYSNRQTKDLQTQTMTTADGQVVAVGCMVRYKVIDAVKAIIDTLSVDRAIVDEALAVLCAYITKRTLAVLLEDRLKINAELTKQIRTALEKYGVYVEKAQLTDFGQGRLLIHAGHFPAGGRDSNGE